MDPQRVIELEGAHNLRDLGGYETENGRTTKWRTYLRSASLEKLSPASHDALVDLGLSKLVDLRAPRELELKPSVFEGSTAMAYVHIDMLGEGSNGPQPPEDMERARRTAWTYCQWLRDRQSAISQILGALAESDGLALYNCAAGTDRTGVISALLLGLAGVPEETIVADYTPSAIYLWPRDRHRFQERNGSNYTLEDFKKEASPAEAMQLTLEDLNQKHGGIRSYVETIGVSDEQVARIRSKFLD